MLTRPPRASLTTSQRVRLTLCVQATRNVPASISRAISGAPQNVPTSAGTTYTRYRPDRPSCERKRPGRTPTNGRSGLVTHMPG